MDIRTKIFIVLSGIFSLMYIFAPDSSHLSKVGVVLALAFGLGAIWSDRRSSEAKRDHTS